MADLRVLILLFPAEELGAFVVCCKTRVSSRSYTYGVSVVLVWMAALGAVETSCVWDALSPCDLQQSPLRLLCLW
jgi:hypothetical protein